MDSRDADSPQPTEYIADISSLPKSSNPAITTDIIEDLEKIKGDSIGDTLYSSRFVLKTLIKLTSFTSTSTLDEDEDFEKDLCILWDMTIEKDVVKLLLEHNVISLFTSIIQTNEEDQRLTEILVGIIGNMCAIPETRSKLCLDAQLMVPLLDLVACTDSLVLVQLMRFLQTVIVFENSDDEICWFNHFEMSEDFVEKFSFILYNSMSSTLLMNAYEALNSICAKFAIIEVLNDGKDCKFSEFFVRPCLVSGVVEAFKVMVPEHTDQSTDDSSLPTKSSQRIMNMFLEINAILSQYNNLSKKSYESCLPDVLQCISRILEPMCNPIYLFPITSNEQGFIENINEIFQSLNDPFHGGCFSKMISIRSMIDAHIQSRKTTEHSEWEIDSREHEINLDDLNITILELITRSCKNGSIDDIVNHVQGLTRDNIVDLYKSLKAGDSEPDIQESCLKLGSVINKLWNFDVASLNLNSSN